MPKIFEIRLVGKEPEQVKPSPDIGRSLMAGYTIYIPFYL